MRTLQNYKLKIVFPQVRELCQPVQVRRTQQSKTFLRVRLSLRGQLNFKASPILASTRVKSSKNMIPLSTQSLPKKMKGQSRLPDGGLSVCIYSPHYVRLLCVLWLVTS